VRSSRLPVLILLPAIIAAGAWYVLSHRPQGPGGNLTVYYTKLDGTTLGNLSVSLRPRQSGETSAEHLHNLALYAAVEAVAGPPSQVHAIRFPAGTRVLDASVNGSTATVDLSKEVEQQPGGSFAESGEFKALVYTMTGVPGIDAVQVRIDGRTLPTLPGGHIELDTPLRRTDW
jgi:hypothetical protein